MTKMPRFKLLLVAIFALVDAHSAVRAEEISSVYTPLKLDACKDVTPDDVKDYGTIWSCKGYDGIDVRVAEGDLRIYVSFGPNAATQTAAQETLPQFNSIADMLEWRVRQIAGSWKAFATILRYRWDSDNGEGSTLVVTKLANKDACHVAYVEGTRNPKANEQARAIADKIAMSFDCKRDTPKHYGADGSLVD
jgi:hypothetical protein